MARTLSVFIAGAILLVAAACMATSRQQSLFYDTALPAQAEQAAAEGIDAAG